MSALGHQHEKVFQELMTAARERRLSVEKTFAAMQAKQITEDEAKELLDYIQNNFLPAWQRLIVGSGSIK